MSLSKTEPALFRLTDEELAELDRRVSEIRAQRLAEGYEGTATVKEMARWSAERERMPEDEAEAFARDIEEGRRWANQPPALSKEWGL